MDKSTFLKAAPDYYAAAIILIIEELDRPIFTLPAIILSWRDKSENKNEVVLRHMSLVRKAVSQLEGLSVIEVITDNFGPSLLVKGTNFSSFIEDQKRNKKNVLGKAALYGNAEHWLTSAIRNVNKKFDELGVTSQDFSSDHDEWAPIPLDRDDLELKKIVESLDNLQEDLRGDNGYAVSSPQEKAYVQVTLETLTRNLKEGATVSLLFIRRYAFDPLGILIQRFKDSAVGIAAQGIRVAITEWIKQRGISLLDNML